MKQKKEKNGGITLIALVITVIVLLILAGISISMLSGENGILTRTTEAKEQTIIGQEKEEVGLAYSSLVGDNIVKGIEITDKLFEDEINKNRGGNDVSVDSDLGDYIVYYESTNHTYLVEKNGNITLIENIEPTEIIYVTLYTDGTLAFSNNNSTDSTRTVSKTYTIAKDDIYDTADKVPWKNERSQIRYADFINKIVPVNTQRWFQGCENLLELKHMINLDTSQTINMSYMFNSCTSLTSLDLSKFNTKNVKGMASMFYGCSSLSTLDLVHFDTNNVTAMNGMFHNCSNLTDLNLSSFNTSKVTTMAYMFCNCSKLTSIDLNGFYTSKVKTMEAMFAYCKNLNALDLNNFETSEVTNMWMMFMGCRKLTKLDLSSFNTNNVTIMNAMFSSWLDDGSNLGDGMSLTTIYVSEKWNTSSVTASDEMFSSCKLLKGGNGTTYNSSKIDKEYAIIDGTNNKKGYFTYKSNSNN